MARLKRGTRRLLSRAKQRRKLLGELPRHQLRLPIAVRKKIVQGRTKQTAQDFRVLRKSFGHKKARKIASQSRF